MSRASCGRSSLNSCRKWLNFLCRARRLAAGERTGRGLDPSTYGLKIRWSSLYRATSFLVAIPIGDEVRLLNRASAMDPVLQHKGVAMPRCCWAPDIYAQPMTRKTRPASEDGILTVKARSHWTAECPTETDSLRSIPTPILATFWLRSSYVRRKQETALRPESRLGTGGDGGT